MKFTKAKIIALAGGAVIAVSLGATACSSAGSSASSAPSTSSSYYQTGVTFAHAWKGYYKPGFNMSGADAAPEAETPTLFCLYEGSTAVAAGDVADAPTAPMSLGSPPASGTPDAQWLAGCTDTITALASAAPSSPAPSTPVEAPSSSPAAAPPSSSGAPIAALTYTCSVADDAANTATTGMTVLKFTVRVDNPASQATSNLPEVDISVQDYAGAPEQGPYPFPVGHSVPAGTSTLTFQMNAYASVDSCSAS